MKRLVLTIVAVLPVFLFWQSCEVVDNDPDRHVADSVYVGLDEVARILAAVPMSSVHLDEVYSAVNSSSDNGYDEEYTMRDLFLNPGAGVGDPHSKAGGAAAGSLRDLIADYVRENAVTKALHDSRAADVEPEDFLDALTDSDIQIYWPFSRSWDGKSMPVMTFDPEDGSEINIGYRIMTDDNGFRHVEKVMVDEEMARNVPVWVVNRNSDADYTTLEMLRRENPEWGEGGGNIIVRPNSAAPPTKTKTPVRTLILKDFTMKRNYDSWFAGASEFFVKTGSVEDFTAATEAELRLYAPTVTDFMVVVKRSQMGSPVPFNAVLVSDWTGQMTHCAFMITEDDGGTRTEWQCTALVRIESKSYGVELKLPFNSRDDIVWRGQLSSRWLEANSNLVGHFGDVDLTFEIVEY